MNITDLNIAMKKQRMGLREDLWGASPQHLFGAVALFQRGQELSVTGKKAASNRLEFWVRQAGVDQARPDQSWIHSTESPIVPIVCIKLSIIKAFDYCSSVLFGRGAGRTCGCTGFVLVGPPRPWLSPTWQCLLYIFQIPDQVIVSNQLNSPDCLN